MKETEWQFDALDLRPVIRWLEARRSLAESTDRLDTSGAPTLAHRRNGFPSVAFDANTPLDLNDTYFDTPDWRFHKAGLSVRIREATGVVRASVEQVGAPPSGKRKRTVISAPLASAETSALLEEPSRLGDWVRALAGNRPPAPLFTLQSNRRPYAILMDGRPVGEVVLEESSIKHVSGREAIRLRRVEIDAPRKALETLRPFVDDLRRACRLSPALASKFEAGLLTLDLSPADLPDVGPMAVSQAPSMGELGFAVLRRAFVAVLMNEPGARVGEDAEALHDMRVAIRRMRAALVLFEPALPVRARTVRRELGWMARRLGDVRDLDIQLDWMRTWAGELNSESRGPLNALTLALHKRRRAARMKMLRSLDSKRYARLVERVKGILQKGPPKRSRGARMQALAVFPALLEQRQSSVVAMGRKIGPDSPPEAYHRLRIRCKRLRYAVENGRELYGPAASGYLEVLVRLQDVLGMHQDACVAKAHLQDLLDREGGHLAPRVVFAMGQASQRYDQRAGKFRRRLPKVFPQVTGKAWTRLKRAMDKGSANLDSVTWPPIRVSAKVPSPGEQGGQT
jgi:triphosphatase